MFKIVIFYFVYLNVKLVAEPLASSGNIIEGVASNHPNIYI